MEVVVVLAIILILIGVAIPTLRQTGNGKGAVVSTNNWISVKKSLIEGHTYLVFDHGVVHDPNCACRQKLEQ